MTPIAIIYGTNGDATKDVAEKLTAIIPESTVFDVAKLKITDIENFDNLILGASTWGLGDLQDDWEGFLPELQQVNLEGKTVALFGLGDSAMYADSFVDGMGILYKGISKTGCTMIGAVSTNGYTFDDSVAVIGDEFVGLAIDEDNEDDLTDTRINEWVNNILPLFQ